MLIVALVSIAKMCLSIGTWIMKMWLSVVAYKLLMEDETMSFVEK